MATASRTVRFLRPARVRDARYGALSPGELGFRGLLAGLNLGERSQRLVHGHLVAFALDDDQNLTRDDRLSFHEGDAVDRAGDACRDLHLLERFEASRGHNRVAHGSGRERGHFHGVLELVGALRLLQRGVRSYSPIARYFAQCHEQ